MCRVCSGALWILQFIAILYEPEHEITVLSGCRAMKAQISLGKMRMLVRVPPKDQDEVRLTLEKKYRITTETHILHATDTLNSNTCWCSSRRCCRGRGLNLARGEIFTASIGSVDLRFNLQSQPNLPHPSLPYCNILATS